MEAAYTFTIPSLEDDTVLDCRVYQAERFFYARCGAIIAHPYAPLGGNQDDAIVLSIREHLLERGYTVLTFNFRGAGESPGNTSWTGNSEQEDYMSVIGFLVTYLETLNQGGDQNKIDVLLAGYSYGSLVLSYLPSVQQILGRFDTAIVGSNAAEIILRARTLATETVKSCDLSRGRQEDRTPVVGRLQAKSLTVAMGGEETEPSQRRLSRDSKDSRNAIDIVRKTVHIPHHIASHLRHRSRSSSKSMDVRRGADTPVLSPSSVTTQHNLTIRYLLISPLLPPLAHALIPPTSLGSLLGKTSTTARSESGFSSLDYASLAIWGTQDSFSSHKRLRTWAERNQQSSQGRVSFAEIAGAGHFWHEAGVKRQMLKSIEEWLLGTLER